MPTYSFETLTAAQALTVKSTDTVTVTSGTATQTTVLFLNDTQYSVTIGTRTVTFVRPADNGAITNLAPGAPIGLFSFSDGTALYVGGVGSDTVDLNPGGLARTGAAYGWTGDEVITGRGGWLVQGNTGADRITMSEGANTIYGGQDNDIVRVGGAGNFAQGNKGDDSLVGSGGTDTLLGGQGNDSIEGSGGTDFINGNLGDDRLTGSGTVLGEGGDDTLTAGTDKPTTLVGGDGNDRLVNGFSVVNGVRQAAVVVISGDVGDDTIDSSNPLAETLSGGVGNDVISARGNEVGDVVDGGDGNDTVTAGGGTNMLQGGNGNDRLTGGNAFGSTGTDGQDTLDGGAGLDTLTGGTGPDVFVFDDSTVAPVIAPQFCDVVTDWGADDHMRLRAPVAGSYTEMVASDLLGLDPAVRATIGTGAFEVVAVQVEGDVYVFADLRGNNTADVFIKLVGRSLADISADNFF